MTEITFQKKSFLSALDAIQTQFQLATTMVHLETEPSGDRFMLAAKRAGQSNLGPTASNEGPSLPQEGPEVRAFGPCQVVGAPVAVDFDIKALETEIINTYKSLAADTVTLLVSDGISVKAPGPATASV